MPRAYRPRPLCAIAPWQPGMPASVGGSQPACGISIRGSAKSYIRHKIALRFRPGSGQLANWRHGSASRGGPPALVAYEHRFHPFRLAPRPRQAGGGLFPFVQANQALAVGQPAPGGMEAWDRHSQRTGTRIPLSSESGHGPQGDRRAGGREPAGAPAGQGHVRDDPPRAALAVPFLALAGQQRRNARGAQPLSRLPARARLGRDCRTAGAARRAPA